MSCSWAKCHKKLKKLKIFEFSQCVLISYIILNSHTHLILTVDLSYTRAPPHLIEALCAMTVCGLRSVEGLKKICAYAWPCNVTLLCLNRNASVKTCCARRKVMEQCAPWAFVVEASKSCLMCRRHVHCFTPSCWSYKCRQPYVSLLLSHQL